MCILRSIPTGRVPVMTYVGTSYQRSNCDARYDAIVIGSGMGGLSAASVLAQKGKAVLLLEQHNVIGGCTQTYARKGYEWNVGLHYIGNLHHENTMTSRLFDYITRSGVSWEPMPETYNRIIIAGKEYPFQQGTERYLENLKSFFPGEEAAIDEYMNLLKLAVKASSAYFALKALPREVADTHYEQMAGPFLEYADPTTYEVLSSLTENQELIAVICGNYGDYSLPPKRSSFAMHAMLVRHYMKSAAYPDGGASSLARSIVPIIEEAGGHAVYSAEVQEVLVEAGRATGVRLVNGDEFLAGTVISNAGVNNTFNRLVPDGVAAKKEMTANLAKVKKSYCAVGLNIGIRADAETLGLHGANIWAHPGNDLDGNIERHRADFSAPFPWSFITFPSAKDKTWNDRFPGKSTIEMFCATDYGHFRAWAGSAWQRRGADYDALKAEIAQRMFAELYKYVPQVEAHVDYFEVSTPISYEHFLRRDEGNFMGVEASPQRFRQPWLSAETPLEGLFLTGQDVTTDGVIGALMAGVITSSRVLGENVIAEIAGR